MSCDCCRAHVPTKYVEFYQNIGMLVLRTSKTVKGDLCKSCIDRFFWKLTLTTAVLGWWGMISAFLTPIFLLNNIVRYTTTLRMKKSLPASAERSVHPTESLTPAAIARLEPFAAEMEERLAAGAALENVAEQVARRAGVSALQAELFAKESRAAADRSSLQGAR
jgi:hypothetical protein